MVKYFKTVLFFLLINSTTKVFCQNPFVYSSQTDSLEKVLKKMPPSIGRIKTLILLCRNYFNKPEEITANLSEIKNLSEKLKYPQGLAEHAYLSGIVTYVKQDYSETNILWNSAYQQFEANKDTLAMIRLSLKLGELNSTWRFRYNDKSNIKHIAYYKRAYLLAKLKKDKFVMITALSRLAHTYEEKIKLDSSIYFYTESIKIAKSINEINPVLGDSYGNLGGVYLTQKKLNLALINLVKADSIYSLYSNTKGSLFNSRLHQSQTLFLLGNSKKANEVLTKSLEQNKENKDFNIKEKYYKLLAEIAEKSNDLKQSLMYHKLAMIAKDSAFNNQDIIKFQEWETKYGAEKKEAENQILSQEKYISEQKTKQYFLLLIIGLISLAAVSALTYSLWKSNLKAKKIEKKLHNLIKFREKLMLIIAHDLRGPLASFKDSTQLLSNLSKRKDFNKMEKAAFFIEDASITLDRLLENLMKWALHENNIESANTENIPLKIFLEDIISLYNPSISTKKILIKIQCADTISIKTNTNLLATIIRNLIFNAIKYSSPESRIDLIVNEKSRDLIEIKVRDSGDGIEPELLVSIQAMLSKEGEVENYSHNIGLGLQLVNEFSKILNSKVTVESQKSSGTTFTLLIPIA